MKKKKLFTLALVLVMILLMAVGCSSGTTEGSQSSGDSPETSQSTEGPSTSNGQEKYVIGLTCQNLANEYVVNWSNASKAEAEKHPDLELIVVDGEGNIEKQIEQINSFIAQGVDMILVNSLDSDVEESTIQAAVNAGIPVIMMLTALRNEIENTTYVGAPDVIGGELEMQGLIDLIGEESNIVIMRGPLGSMPEIQRGEGYENILTNYPNVNVLYDQTGNWDRAEGMALMENWLQTGNKIDGVIAQNDEMSLGAIQALQDAGLLEETVVVGLDGVADALYAVKNGTMAFTVMQDHLKIGTAGVDLAYRVLTGEASLEDVVIPFTVIDSSNVDEYIEYFGY